MRTVSIDFPTTHQLQPNHRGPDDFPQDAFVAKISADGSALLYSTYLGGTGEDFANGIAVDTFGNAYVTGTTLSFDFPVTPGSFNTLCGGDGKCGATWNTQQLIVSNGFVTKLNPAGSGIIYSGFVGEFENVRGQAIALDNDQIAYVTGQTGPNGIPSVPIVPPATPPPPFPIVNALQTVFGGGPTDGFIMKISATGTTIEYSSYIGGSNEEIGYGVTVDGAGVAYVTGLTYSPDFPTVSPLQGASGGAGDAFVSKVNTRLSGPASLLYSTYLGGSGLDQGNGIAIDSTGNAYIAGTTASSSFVFTPNGFQTTNHGQGDAFAAKLTPTGALSYFTFLGGSLADSGVGIAVDASGNAHITGTTVSANDFPLTTPVFQHLYGGGNADAFVTKLNPAGTVLLYSSFLGGTNTELAGGIAVDTVGSAYVAGQTCSLDFPLANPLQASSGGNCDAYVSKVSVLGGLAISPAGLVFPAESLGTTSGPMTVTLTNSNDIAPVTINSLSISGTNPGDFVQTNTCPGTLAAEAQCTVNVIFHPNAAGIRKAAVTVNDSGPGNPHIITLNGSTSTVSLSTSSLSFGTQQVNATSPAQTVTVTNNGTVPLAFAGITASGDFAQSNNCSVALQPSSSCVITVTFKPMAAGASTGAVTLSDNGSGSPQIVLLNGTGVGQNADFTIAAVSPSATISAGQSAAYNLAVTPFGGFSQPVALSCTGLPRGAACSFSPNPAMPGGSNASTVTISTALRAMVVPGTRNVDPTGWDTNMFGRPLLLSVVFVLSLFCLVGLARRRGSVAFGSAVALLLLCSACSGGSQAGVPAGTPAGSYQVTVVGTSGSLSHTAAVTLQVN